MIETVQMVTTINFWIKGKKLYYKGEHAGFDPVGANSRKDWKYFGLVSK
jgi:hypothetical protein